MAPLANGLPSSLPTLRSGLIDVPCKLPFVLLLALQRHSDPCWLRVMGLFKRNRCLCVWVCACTLQMQHALVVFLLSSTVCLLHCSSSCTVALSYAFWQAGCVMLAVGARCCPARSPCHDEVCVAGNQRSASVDRRLESCHMDAPGVHARHGGQHRCQLC